MFALIAAIAFAIGAIVDLVHNHDALSTSTFWVLVGLCFWALHFAYTVALPARRTTVVRQ